MKRLLRILLTGVILFVGTFISSGMAVHAAQVTEDFESVTIVDANGNELANQWTAGAGLSNGWKIIGGTIYTGDTGDYQLVHKAGKGWLYSDYYLSSSSTSQNSAYVFIPVKMTGTVQFFAKSNLNSSSKKTSAVKVLEAAEDGTVTTTILYSANPAIGGNWGMYTFDIEGEEGKYIAINLVYTDVDDITYNTAEGGQVIIPSLTVSATAVDFGTTQVAVNQTITIKSNVATSVTMNITGDGAEAFTLVDAPTTLTANIDTNVNIKMQAQAADTYSATLTITAGKLIKTVALTGVWEEKQPEQQPENWKGEDFNAYREGDTMPMGWVADGWAIGEPVRLNTPAVVTTSGGTLITPVFEVTGNQALQFYFDKTAIGWSGYDSKLVVSYTTDKEVWTETATYDKNESDGTKKVVLPAAGSYFVRFVANDRTYLDDFLVVDHTETGIADVRGQKEDVRSGAYNLQGQRVAQPAKGIYIQNGKKFIEK